MGRKKPEKQLTIKLRAYADTARGKMIDYLRGHPDGAEALVMETMSARFMPFVLSEEDEQLKDLALQYVEKIESYARAARLRWQLPEFQLSPGAPFNNGSIELEFQSESSEELEPESSAAVEENESKSELAGALEEEEELDEEDREWERRKQERLAIERTIGLG